MKKILAGTLLLVALPVLLPLAGCAGYKVQPIDPVAEWPPKEEGYIIYEPVPHLKVVVAKDKDGKFVVTTETIHLPDRSRPYRVSTYAYLASANIQIAYKDGWMLTGVSSDVDTAEVAKAVIEAAAGAVAARMPDPNAPSPTDFPLRPGIYVFRLDGTGLSAKLTPVIAIPPL